MMIYKSKVINDLTYTMDEEGILFKRGRDKRKVSWEIFENTLTMVKDKEMRAEIQRLGMAYTEVMGTKNNNLMNLDDKSLFANKLGMTYGELQEEIYKGNIFI